MPVSGKSKIQEGSEMEPERLWWTVYVNRCDLGLKWKSERVIDDDDDDDDNELTWRSIES